MAALLRPIKWLYKEFGLSSLTATGSDAILIILGRCVRMFAYGATSLIIALFFSALSFPDERIGLFMTLTLLGDVLLSLFLTLVADRVGRRRILLTGAALMVVSGSVFAYFENFWILLLAAVLGVISATGSDFGPFRAIEESMLSHLTEPKTRADVLAWYVTTSSLGSAVGTEISGRAVDLLKGLDGWEILDAYHAVFWLYIIMGSVLIVFTLLMSKRCEIAEKANEKERGSEAAETLLNERQQREEVTVEGNHSDAQDMASPIAPKPSAPPKRSLFAQISAPTRTTMYKLWILLAIDSLADGMVSYSLTNYYLDRKFVLSKSTLGDIASISYFLAAASTIFASPLARRLGLINTMVFTHLPSSLAVLLFPFPSSVALTVTLFFIRTGLNNMDQAPRAAFIAAVVKPEERTAVMGVTGMIRTLASTVGPSVTGLLAGSDRFWVAFVVAGSLRVAYDFGLWGMFVNVKLEGEEKAEEGRGAIRDEEEMRELEPVTPGSK